MADSENILRRQLAEQMQENFAAGLNAVAWALLRKTGRTPAEDEKMLYAAYASAFHHLETGDAADQQRAEWLLSRVHAALGNGREALRHAKRCMELTEAGHESLADFDRAFAFEAWSRANAVAGNRAEADKYRKLATEAGEQITDAAARKVFTDEQNA